MRDNLRLCVLHPEILWPFLMEIAQLLIPPSLHKMFFSGQNPRGDKGFVSTGTNVIYICLDLEEVDDHSQLFDGSHGP